MLAKLFLQYVLAVLAGIGVDEGYATVYGTPGDPQDGEILACGGAAIPQDKPVCAHRWLPCGTELTVTHLRRGTSMVCTVADRGPYGFDRGTGRWRGILDMTPYAARALRLDGKDYVRMVYRLPPPRSRTFADDRFLSPAPIPELRRRDRPAF